VTAGSAGGQAWVIEPMGAEDIPQVATIDRATFANPWSEASYRYEVTENEAAHFLVALTPPGRRVVGFAGYWLVVDEAHIATLAVHAEWRRRGLGEQLLAALLQQARALGALSATLEVRAGNAAAQRLYARHAFAEVGRRAHYYQDNGEDALLLTAKL
jgi:ribosomal-protein-alanine N-acetyltransferase